MERSVLNIFFGVWIGILLLRSMEIFGSYPPIDLWTWAVIFIWLVVFSIGALAGRTVKLSPRSIVPDQLDRRWQNRWAKRMSLVAILGAAALTYEFAILRGYGFSLSVSQIRIEEVMRAETAAGVSVIGGMGRLMTPALQLAVVLAFFCWRNISVSTKIFLLVAAVAVFMQQFAFEGGRNFWASLAIQCFIVRMRDPGRKKLNINPSRVVIFALLFFYVLYVFVDRINERGIPLAFAYGLQAQYHDLEIPSELTKRLGSTLGPVWFAFGMLWLYITHGVHQLEILLFDPDLNYAFGMHQFSVAGQIFAKLTGLDVSYNDFEELLVPAVYTTLIGASVIDFGVFGAMVFGFILAFFTMLGLRRLARGEITFLAMSAPALSAIVLASPVLSMAPNAWLSLLWVWLILPRGRSRARNLRTASLNV